jgi:hypothetical protein
VGEFPLNAVRYSLALLVATLILGPNTAWGQRVRFASQVPDAGSGWTTPGPAPPPLLSPSTAPPAFTPSPAVAAPSTAPVVVPNAAVPPAGTTAPGQPTWDPYADPAAQPPFFTPSGSIYTRPDGTIAQRPRLTQDIDLKYTWLSANKHHGFGTNDNELFGTFTFPLIANQQPFLVTPGFALHLWDGPDSNEFPGADLPPEVFDAYIEFGWKPQLTSIFRADLGIRPGVYSDFHFINGDSFRVKGHGYGIVDLSSTWSLAAGVEYINRHHIKLLPAGGLLWRPNPDTEWAITFPSPRLAQRFTTVGVTEWWWYVRGEYGGGAWTVKRASGLRDGVDYNDLRVVLGTEWRTNYGPKGYFEVGYVFDRQILYLSDSPPEIKPNDTVMLGAGLIY